MPDERDELVQTLTRIRDAAMIVGLVCSVIVSATGWALTFCQQLENKDATA